MTDDMAEDPFLPWARARVRSHASDAALLDVLSGARVVAVGEPGHGAEEPLALRNRIVRLLAARGTLGAVALESDALAARALDTFVRGGPGDAATLAAQHLSWGFGRLRANVELLQWLREHNRGRIEQVGWHAFDLPAPDGHREVVGVRRAVRCLATCLNADPAVDHADLVKALEALDGQLATAGVQGLDGPGREAARALLDAVPSALGSHGAGEGIDDVNRARAVRAARAARAALDMVCLWPPMPHGATAVPDADIPAVLDASAVRDRFMAEQVLWLLQSLPVERCLLVFAANGHVVGGPHVGGLWAGRSGAGLPAGAHLRRALGDGLRVLLTTSPASLPGAACGPGSIDHLMAALGPADALLDLRGAPPHSWVDVPQSIGTNGPYPQAFVPRGAVDAFACLDTLTPSPPP